MESVPAAPAVAGLTAQQFAQQLAELARIRKPLEVRILIELTASGGQAQLSSRDLAVRMEVSRRHLLQAKNSLEADGLIACQGTPRRVATWCLGCFSTAEAVPQLPGAQRGPDGANPAPDAGAQRGPGGAQRGPDARAAGAKLAPAPNGVSAGCEYDTKERARAPVDSIDRNLKLDIDRLQKPANPKYDAEQIRVARNALHSYMLKFGRQENAKPPDEKITAQFLDIAPWPELTAVLYDLQAERKEPGYSYAWFVTVATQRIHGLSPAEQKARRDALRKPPQQADRELFNRLLEHTQMRGYFR